jgi:hypothetical protein
LWDDLSGQQEVDIVRQLATFSAQLSKIRFPFYGSLYLFQGRPRRERHRKRRYI